MDLAYVVRGVQEDGDHVGVLVVKTGRQAGEGNSSTKPRREVQLVRPSQQEFSRPELSSSQCSPSEEYVEFKSSVSSNSYDQYHDYGYHVTGQEQEALEKFHFSYQRDNGQCRRTDSVRVDFYILLDFRTNSITVFV